MILRVYSVRDSKAGVYNQPFFAKTHGEAERIFTAGIRDPKTMLAQFPEDYDLYFCGTFDDDSGLFDVPKTPEHIMKAIAVNAAERGVHAV